MDRLILGFILGSLFESFNYLLLEPMKRKWRRQCKYDCSKCKVWDCDKHLCRNQKIKDIKKGRINEDI